MSANALQPGTQPREGARVREESAADPMSIEKISGERNARTAISNLECRLKIMPQMKLSISAFSLSFDQPTSAHNARTLSSELDQLAQFVQEKMAGNLDTKRAVTRFVHAAAYVQNQVHSYNEEITDMRAQAGSKSFNGVRDKLASTANTLNHIQHMEIPGAATCMAYLIKTKVVRAEFSMPQLLELAEGLGPYLGIPQPRASDVPLQGGKAGDMQAQGGRATSAQPVRGLKRETSEDLDILDLRERRTSHHGEFSTFSEASRKEVKGHNRGSGRGGGVKAGKSQPTDMDVDTKTHPQRSIKDFFGEDDQSPRSSRRAPTTFIVHDLEGERAVHVGAGKKSSGLKATGLPALGWPRAHRAGRRRDQPIVIPDSDDGESFVSESEYETHGRNKGSGRREVVERDE
ncbi:hypothetical protein PV08_07189 [Exophiala spinifera]|uniref:Uncharacterized protein n=1 Tax=Exophiala spinifera TaxID=91928 RepID=A0A0D1ZNJ1_9EURO|nr:uncharacterized protein PV08_07189 [Exophiala spinifera]KIW14407.1 hypothetical protein PV08_07189 [Exophiala spinifera]